MMQCEELVMPVLLVLFLAGCAGIGAAFIIIMFLESYGSAPGTSGEAAPPEGNEPGIDKPVVDQTADSAAVGGPAKEPPPGGVTAVAEPATEPVVPAPQSVPPAPEGGPRFCLMCGKELKFGLVEGGKEKLHCDCGYIHWNNPVPVSVLVIPHASGGVVLIKRKLPPAAGSWALPAGFVDAFESPKQAAAREALEETHLQIEVDRLLDVVMTPGKNTILHFYLAKPCAQLPQAGDDALDAQIFPLDQLPEMPFSTHRDILRRCVEQGLFQAA
jgi:8-oxo-dGTP diphosphatase